MLADIIIMAAIIGYCVFLIWRRNKRKKENKGKPGCGGGCSGGCAGCPGCQSVYPDSLYKDEKK